MKSLLKSIGNVLLSPSEDSPPLVAEADEVAPVSSGATSAPVQVVSRPIFSQPVASPADPQLVEQIRANVAASTSPAYTKFASMKSSLQGVVPDGPMLIQAALKASGVSKEELLRALAQKASVLESEHESAKNQAEAHRQQTVGATQTQISSVGQSIEQKSGQVVQLQTQIEQLRVEISDLGVQKTELERSIPDQEAKVQAGLGKFAAAHAVVLAELQTEHAAISGVA